jgi:hypothetical protein
VRKRCAFVAGNDGNESDRYDAAVSLTASS